MTIKFEKCKRRFDVTATVTEHGALRDHKAVVFNRTTVVWAYGPSLYHLTDAICVEANVSKRDAEVAITYVREHEFHEYSPAQLGIMMAQEGYGFTDNPFVTEGSGPFPGADAWSDAWSKENRIQQQKRN